MTNLRKTIIDNLE